MIRMNHTLSRLAVCIGVCLIVLSRAPVASAQPPGSSIDGRVVLTGSNQPVPSVDIHVFGGPTQVPPLKTDERGRFRFERLEPGRYALMLIPGSGYRAREMLIDVGENQQIKDVEVKAYAGATVSGRVRDIKERPLAGLVVSALRLHGGGARFPPDRGTAAPTNDLGEYKLTGLNPGRYALLVETRRSSVSPIERKDDETLPEPAIAEIRTYYPNATSLELAVPVQMEAGQVVEGMDITLARADSYCVSSRVVDPRDGRMDGVRVQIGSEAYLGASVLADGVIGPNSGFEACGLPPGAYSLLAGPLSRGEDERYASEAFTITDRSLRLPDLLLAPLVQLSGRLTIDASTSDIRALPGPVSISLSSIGRPTVLHQRSSVRVTEPGSFSVPAVLPAQYWLSVRTPVGFYTKSAAVDGRDALREPLHASGRELHIVLGQDAAQVSVVVLGPKDNTVPSASLIVGLDSLPPSFTPGELFSTDCDQNGQVTLGSLAPGRYRVLAFGETLVDPANAAALFRANRLKGEEITLGPGERRSVSVHAIDLRD